MIPERRPQLQPENELEEQNLTVEETFSSDVIEDTSPSEALSLFNRLQEKDLNEPIEHIQKRALAEIKTAYNTLIEVLSQEQLEDENPDDKQKNNNNPVLKAHHIVVMAKYIWEQSPSIKMYMQRSKIEKIELWKCIVSHGYTNDSILILNKDGVKYYKREDDVDDPSLIFLQERYDFQYTRTDVYKTPLCKVLSTLTIEDVCNRFSRVIGDRLGYGEYFYVKEEEEEEEQPLKSKSPPKKRWNPFKR
jgi:hypothetical protein